MCIRDSRLTGGVFETLNLLSVSSCAERSAVENAVETRIDVSKHRLSIMFSVVGTLIAISSVAFTNANLMPKQIRRRIR